jgi:FkbM family methyltransferase
MVPGGARPLSRYVRAIPHAHRYVSWFGRAARLFTEPTSFLRHYLARTSPAGNLVAMRDGTRIRLSGHPHDLITLFVIFVREEYGRFPGRGTIVDIGANLGMFALYAARQGAARVIAYEPNGSAYKIMEENLACNARGADLRARRLAVSGEHGKRVRFPVAPSVYNRIAEEGESGTFETVETTSLAQIVATDAPGGIDLLKLDCEGAEYDILYAPDAPLESIREIRMEYHGGRGQELAGFLRGRGFRIDKLEPDSPWTGMLWASRAA